MISYIKDRLLSRRLLKDEKEIKLGFTVTGLLIVALLANVAYLNFLIVNKISITSLPQISVVSTPIASQSPAPTITSTSFSSQIPNSTVVTPKDYYLNFGSGTNQSTDWTDVSGTVNTYDLGQYRAVAEVRLESTINIPTANGAISVRLFNKTDNYAVWNSERTIQAQAKGDLIISEKIIYDTGPKMYQIQMKSQLGVPAILTQARLHIVVQ